MQPVRSNISKHKVHGTFDIQKTMFMYKNKLKHPSKLTWQDVSRNRQGTKTIQTSNQKLLK